jgi:hypothetical protein
MHLAFTHICSVCLRITPYAILPNFATSDRMSRTIWVIIAEIRSAALRMNPIIEQNRCNFFWLCIKDTTKFFHHRCAILHHVFNVCPFRIISEARNHLIYASRTSTYHTNPHSILARAHLTIYSCSVKMPIKTSTIRSGISESGEQEVTLERSARGYLMVCVKDISVNVTSIWGCKDNDDATFRYNLAVRTGSFTYDETTILAEIMSAHA